MQAHLRTITRFLLEYGATNINVTTAGSGNTKVAYLWKGQPKVAIVPSTPSDGRALNNIIGDIKRLLGPPLQAAPKARSTLEELTADAVRRADSLADQKEEPPMETNQLPLTPPLKEFIGKVAHYARSNTINVVLPVDAMASFQHEGGTTMRLGFSQNGWIIIEANTTMKNLFAAHTTSNGFVTEYTGNETTAAWPEFGRTPVKMFIRKGHCEFKINLDSVTPKRQHRRPTATPFAKPVEPEPQASPVEHRETMRVIDGTYLRNVIITINEVEANSPYKLKRIDGAWVWAAYITADDA